MKQKRKIHIGQQFTELIVVKKGEAVNGHSRWIVKCQEHDHPDIVFADNLLNGKTQRCKTCALRRLIYPSPLFLMGWTGDSWLCLDGTGFVPITKKEDIPQPAAKPRRKPGRRSTTPTSHKALSTIYYGMMRRCYDPSHPYYHRYGGRGVQVSPEWQDRETFIVGIIALIGERPSGKSLDRISGKGHYSPNNVRWATAKEQTANRDLYMNDDAEPEAGIEVTI